MEHDTDVDDLPVRRRRSRTVTTIAAGTMIVLALGAVSPLLLGARSGGAPRLAGWARSGDGRGLLVAVTWGPPAKACGDVYLRDAADPTRTSVRIWRDCGVADATARFDGTDRVTIGSDATPGALFSTGFDLEPLRAAPVRCTTRCGDDPAARAVAEAFDPPSRRGGTA
jgi:hypothetical protein